MCLETCSFRRKKMMKNNLKFKKNQTEGGKWEGFLGIT